MLDSCDHFLVLTNSNIYYYAIIMHIFINLSMTSLTMIREDLNILYFTGIHVTDLKLQHTYVHSQMIRLG